jgi:hypothetical protein
VTLAPIPILDKYAHGISKRSARQPWLATISAGTRDPSGLPRASRRDDPQWIHIAPGEDVPGLRAVLEAGHWRELTIALPSNDHEDFLSQRFVRYSATRVEAFGDAEEIHVLRSHKVTRGKSTVDEPLPRETHRHGTLEYDREVDQCSVAGSLLFVLARWADGQPELYFPDEALGLYRLRFTSRTSLERLVGGIEQLRHMTGGSVAGLPLRLSLQFGEVADAGGAKRTVPYWAVRFLPPPGAGALTAETWLGFKAAAYAEDATLRALPPGAAGAVTADVVEAEGPDVDLDDPPLDRETVVRLAARHDQIFAPADVIEVHGNTVKRGEVLREEADHQRSIGKHATADLRQAYNQLLSDARRDGVLEADEDAAWTLPEDADEAAITGLGRALRARVEKARAPKVTVRSELGQRLAELVHEAAAMDLDVGPFEVRLPAPRAEVDDAIAGLDELITRTRREISDAAAQKDLL